MQSLQRRRVQRSWRKFTDAIITLQRALPESDDPEVRRLKDSLYRARISAEALMTR